MRRLITLGLGGVLALSAWADNENRNQDRGIAAQNPIGGGVNSADEGKLRTAVVNIQELFRKFHKVHKAEEEINMERARIQKEHNDVAGRLRSMDQSLRELAGSLQATDLSDRDRYSLDREKGVRLHERERLNHEQRSNLHARHTELNRKMAARMDSLLKELHDLVAVHAERLGFDLVFDIDGANTSQGPILLFAKEATNLTPMILNELNGNARSGR